MLGVKMEFSVSGVVGAGIVIRVDKLPAYFRRRYNCIAEQLEDLDRSTSGESSSDGGNMHMVKELKKYLFFICKTHSESLDSEGARISDDPQILRVCPVNRWRYRSDD